MTTRPANASVRALVGDGQNVDVIHDRIREAILRGELPPSQALSQLQLSKDLGVSRTVLREALRMLIREGLLEGEPNRRLRVAGFSVRDMEQLYVERVTLEAVAIRITTPRLTSQELARLEGEMAQMAHFAEEEDYESWEIPHRAFHAGLVAHAGERVADDLARLSDHAERYRRLYTTRAPLGWSHGVTKHRQILDACKARDPDSAAQHLAQHLANTVLRVVEMVEPDYDPVSLRTALEVACTPVGRTRRGA